MVGDKKGREILGNVETERKEREPFTFLFMLPIFSKWVGVCFYFILFLKDKSQLTRTREREEID